jgi:hypothetical protein
MKVRAAGIATCAIAILAIGTPANAGKRGKKRTLTAATIIDRMIDQDPLGFGGGESRVLMVLVNKRSHKRKRKMITYSRTDGDTRRTFVRFTSPADIAGTSFLSIDDRGDRVQYLHLPALAKTRRISGTQRNARFVGTDYSYADMDFRDIEDSHKTRLPDDHIGKRPCYVVDATPSSKESAYGRARLWIGKTTWLPLRIRFYDRDGEECKRLTVQEVKKVEDRWIIDESKMVDLNRRHTTVLKVLEIALRDDVPLDQFSVRALERE